MQQLIDTLKHRFPHLTFSEGTAFYWSPINQTIYYRQDKTNNKSSWSLLHETGHALLNHQQYILDFELLQLELAAWEKATALGSELGITINLEHIEDCLDSYRDWLYARSICPLCSNKGIQQSDPRLYRCFNCASEWKVAPSRFCRAYRMVGNGTTVKELTFE